MNGPNSVEAFVVDNDPLQLENYTAPAPAPSKPKRLAKKTREALEREYNRGYTEALDRDRGTEMLGTLGIIAIAMLVGLGLGAWLF